MHEPFSVKRVSDQEYYTFCFSCDEEYYINLGNGLGNRIMYGGNIVNDIYRYLSYNVCRK